MLLLTLSTGEAAAGPAIGQFELKNLESGPGYLEFQSQNAWSWGQPARRSAPDPDDAGELLFDDNTVLRQRHALEMEMGYTTFFKTRIGIEFEKERFDDPGSLADADGFDSLKLSELGAEAIVIFVPRNGDGVGLGAVAEVEHPLDGEANSLILGPIIELASGPWSASLIPMFVRAFGGETEPGEHRDTKWDFAYAAQLAYTLSETWILTVEAYGTVERIGNTGHRSEEARIFGDRDQHRIGPIVYYSCPLDGARPSKPKSTETKSLGVREDEEEGSTLTVGVGMLAGLNENTPDGTLKLSVEVDF